MSNQLNDYSAGSVNWRNTLQQNSRRTFVVIAVFFAIYIALGLLVDTYIASGMYPKAPLESIFYALVTFQIFPLATTVMVIVAGISLWVTYTFSDQLMLLGTDYHEITAENASTPAEKQLYNVVEEMRIAAGLQYMPKVYIINADYMNAFASGYSEKSAMMAITRGLMEKLDRDELQAVMAHELSHIRHLDIKLTLTASLLANLTLMVLDMFFYTAMYSNRSNDSKSRNNLALIIILLRYLLPLINIVLLLYLSRSRELMADAGCVELTRNNEPLARALIKISSDYSQNSDAYTDAHKETPHENVRREAYIFDPTQAGIKYMGSVNDLFSTHPSLEKRLEALGYKRKD
ncbi:MAG TPA: zinc metalloprotease HtpX [Gammaproteobacteria bacterium]|nr:zinc metalloprotease HtpX [Gammaproteobacteria bacterium]